MAVRERLRVLVADDEPHIGKIIKMKLEQGPFDVTLAYDGQEAMDVLEQGNDFALIVLDLMMPRLSGLDVLLRLRSDDRWKSLPCIVLTAAGEQQYQRRALEIGASEFLTKPFSPRKLYARAAELAGAGSENAEVREA
ncbi:MAG: response regulator [Anaerolineae bacterium]|nr:response regulator [Gemmatimonadaceae bacterium]